MPPKIPVLKTGKLSHQMIAYLFAAAIAGGTDVLTMLFFLNFTPLHYTACVTFGFIFGTFVNFLISDRFVFRRKDNYFSTFLKHFASSLLGLVTNLLVVILCVEFFELAVLPAKIIALGVGFIVNFTAIKLYAFRDFSV